MTTLPIFHQQRHTATKAGVTTVPTILYAVMIRANGGNVDVQIIDAVTDTGTDEIDISVLDGDTVFFDFSPLGGVSFLVALSLTASSNAAIVLWTDIVQLTA